VADDLGREAMTGIAAAGGCRHPTCLSGPIRSHKPGSRQLDGAITQAERDWHLVVDATARLKQLAAIACWFDQHDPAGETTGRA
jgi:hypothetical protein